MTSDTEVLLELDKVQWDQITHAEGQRAQISNLILIIASAVYGFIAQKGLNRDVLPLTILLIGLGLYGVLACQKLYERWWFWRRRVEILEEKLDKLHPQVEIAKSWRDAQASQDKAFRTFSRIRLHYVWNALHLGISLSGLVLTAIVLVAY